MNVWEGDDPFGEARDFCTLWGVDGPVLVDVDGSAARRLGIRGVPTNVVVDEDGTVVCVGASTPAALEEQVDRLLGGGAARRGPGGDWHWGTDPLDIEARLEGRTRRRAAPPAPGPDGS